MNRASILEQIAAMLPTPSPAERAVEFLKAELGMTPAPSRWLVRVVTTTSVVETLVDCLMPGEAVDEAWERLAADEQLVSISVSDNPMYRKWRDTK